MLHLSSSPPVNCWKAWRAFWVALVIVFVLVGLCGLPCLTLTLYPLGIYSVKIIHQLSSHCRDVQRSGRSPRRPYAGGAWRFSRNPPPTCAPVPSALVPVASPSTALQAKAGAADLLGHRHQLLQRVRTSGARWRGVAVLLEHLHPSAALAASVFIDRHCRCPPAGRPSLGPHAGPSGRARPLTRRAA